MFKKYSLSKQINLSFLAIISCTFISTIAGWFIIFVIALHFLYPANYYDQQLPKWIDYVNHHSSELLNGHGEEELNQLLDFEDVTYQVINFEKNESDGTSEVKEGTKQQLLLKINTRDIDFYNNTKHYIPLLTSTDELGGCIIITYPIRMISIQNNSLIYSFFSLCFLSLPFLFLGFYMWLFGRKLRINILVPIRKLTWAAKNINNNNLEFELSYDYRNEFQDVIVSFEQMRQTLKESLNEQWKIEQQQKELISSLAHDLRSPLTVIKGHVEMLQDGAYRYEDRCVKYLNVLEGATSRAILLVEDLNLLSQVEQVDFKLTKEGVLVKDFFLSQVSLYEGLAKQRNINLTLNLKDINPCLQIEIDRNQIVRVLDNLVMNAFRYAPHSSTITIHLDSDDYNLYVEVIDEGEGFSDYDLKYGINKFYRGNKARTKDGGSGLGLYISKRIIDLHDGSMKLTNTLTGGARVIITLPI